MEPVVRTKYGKVQGIMNGKIYQFHGIPYAKPPVGALRFQMPEALEQWEGIYDATFRHSIAPQGASDLDLPMGPIGLPRNEDCLTLSVSTPSLEGKLPVTVWLHGGANCYGGGDLEWYDGAKLADTGNIVIVNLNFRLGPFGFLQYPGVNEHNLSIEDQMLALRWVKENIESFGGDTKKITIFGQSAGANAIVHILARPDSEGLFQQIILESPSLGRGNHRQKDAFEIGENIVRNLGISSEEKDVVKEQLQNCSEEEILMAANQVSPELVSKYQGMIFKPVMDEWYSPEETVQAAAKEAARRNIRVVIGTTKEEMCAFIIERDEQSLKKAAEIQWMRYELPARNFAISVSQKGCSVWKYRFDWCAPKSLFKSCHCLELPFVFGNLDAWNAPMLKGASNDELLQLKDTMQEYWCRFFRFEIPDPEIWPEYKEDLEMIKCFDNQENPVIREVAKRNET